MFELRSWLGLAVVGVGSIVLAVVVAAIVTLVMHAVGKRAAWARLLARQARTPFRVLLIVIAAWIAVTISLPAAARRDWGGGIHHVFLIATIIAGVWFAAALLIFVEDLGLARYRLDVPDNRYARRVRTQVLIIRRLTVVAAVIVAVGAVLLTFPGVRVVGGSILASAGLISVVAGIAAQSTLGNVFAGMQLAFNGAIRLDDVVVVEQQWGKIEEITLTYVVVHIWDDRRLVLPSTYFTTQPFENWTRQTSQLLGSVEFDLDWRVTPAQMREELNRLLARTDLWDGRVGILQVTDAVGGFVHVRVLVTAKDAPTLFDLRCYVREGLVGWLTRSSEQSLPHSRVELKETGGRASRARRQDADAEGLFTGSADAEKRATQFTESIPVQKQKRPAEAGEHAGRAPQESPRE
jgi:small-conductance mechanosensitive channel